MGDFVIENGLLTKYTGAVAGHVQGVLLGLVNRHQHRALCGRRREIEIAGSKLSKLTIALIAFLVFHHFHCQI